MRVLIVEEALLSPKGHWPAYISTLAGGFRRAGDSVTVLTHQNADPAVLAAVLGTPWMRRSCWSDPRSQGKWGGLAHNYFFARDTLRFLADSSPFDWILHLTVRRQHLFGLSALASWLRRHHPETRQLCLFVQGFGSWDDTAGEVVFPPTLSNHLARLAFRLLQPHLHSHRVVLSAETPAMVTELTRFSSHPVRLFPHPVPLEDFAAGQSTLSPPPPAGLPLLAAPGFARHDKGSDLLQDAILRLLAGNPPFPARFLLQWLDPFTLPDGSTCQPHPVLRHHPCVELLDRPLAAPEYWAVLARASALLLPYRPGPYRDRVSRVAIEAACLGRPILYSPGTWTEDLVRGGAAAGLPLPEISLDGLMRGLRCLLDALPELSAQARALAPRARDLFSPDHFRHNLVLASQHQKTH